MDKPQLDYPNWLLHNLHHQQQRRKGLCCKEKTHRLEECFFRFLGLLKLIYYSDN